MYVSNLALDDFRSYRRLVLEFPPGVVAFIGRNGQGKTNIVESLVYLSTFSSHRVAADAALVRRALDGGPQPGGAMVRTKVRRGERAEVLELEIVAGRANRARLNRGTCRPRELLGRLRTVLFAPEDLSLVKGDPAGRRDFLDALLIQHTPRLAGVKADLDKVLRQRGALLKQLAGTGRGPRGGYGTGPDAGYGAAEESLLAVWDEQLVELGAQLLAARLELVEKLVPLAERYYREVADSQDLLRLELVVSAREHAARGGYAPPEAAGAGAAELDELRRVLRAAIAARRADELRRGVNLVGPQRDDLTISLNGLPAKGYASHGESWSCALALRLASFELLRGLDGDPVLILDDVFAELDAKRRAALVGVVAGVEQVFITAAVGEDVPAELDAARFAVAGSQVTSLDGRGSVGSAGGEGTGEQTEESPPGGPQ
ncbi:DNA replication/repair protein RecF [Buchananella felis]|uniref:DNA replication/repair protein RecF n=1 Tax=Buchananella felis TaxID=3231492 RepID=UPI0035296E38